MNLIRRDNWFHRWLKCKIITLFQLNTIQFNLRNCICWKNLLTKSGFIFIFLIIPSGICRLDNGGGGGGGDDIDSICQGTLVSANNCLTNERVRNVFSICYFSTMSFRINSNTIFAFHSVFNRWELLNVVKSSLSIVTFLILLFCSLVFVFPHWKKFAALFFWFVYRGLRHKIAQRRQLAGLIVFSLRYIIMSDA